MTEPLTITIDELVEPSDVAIDALAELLIEAFEREQAESGGKENT